MMIAQEDHFQEGASVNKSEKCPFNEVIDIKIWQGNSTLTQCPVCGAYRTMKQAFEDGAVYLFPAHKKITRQSKDQPSWKRISHNLWIWQNATQKQSA
jgi:hypothetical protein